MSQDYYIGPPESSEFYIEPWVGFRTWYLTSGGESLSPITYTNPDYHWLPTDDKKAVCLDARKNETHDKEPPIFECKCGYWAYNTYPILQAKKTVWNKPLVTIRGVVIGWGRTEIHRDGWRSQFSRPIALLAWLERRSEPRAPYLEAVHGQAATPWNEVAEKTAENFNIPLFSTAKELIAFAESFSTL